MRRLLLLAVVIACGGSSSTSTTTSAPPNLIVKVSGSQPLTIASPGGTLQLGAYLQENAGGYGGGTTLTQVTASWSSSATSVATVDQTGLVTAVASGTADITASASGATGKTTITVGTTAAATTIEWNLGAQTMPVTTTITAGTPVRWFASDTRHTVEADATPPPDAVSINGGSTSPAQIINAKGTYHYHCSIHPGMHGTLVVQ